MKYSSVFKIVKKKDVEAFKRALKSKKLTNKQYNELLVIEATNSNCFLILKEMSKDKYFDFSGMGNKALKQAVESRSTEIIPLILGHSTVRNSISKEWVKENIHSDDELVKLVKNRIKIDNF
jgi:hypothetical protein